MSNSIFRKDGTAQDVAKQRLMETLAEPDKRVINDPYARRFFAGAGVMKLMGHKLNVGLIQKLAPGFDQGKSTLFTLEGVSQYVAKDAIASTVVEEIAGLLSKNGFAVVDNKCLADLNAAYFGPVGRLLPENQLMNLERFVVTKS